MAWTNPAILSIVRWNRKPVSVLSRHLSSQPTPWQGRAALSIPTEEGIMPVYMVLQALVPSPSYVAIWRREPLPHGFTLTLAGGLFSVTASIRLLPSVLSTAGCPFLSGLSSGLKPSDRSSHLMSICIRARARSCHSAFQSFPLPCVAQE